VSRPTFLSLGSVNADFEMRAPEELGRSETLAVQDLRRLSGGKAANRAWLARRFGHDARLFGCVGDDDLADQALAGPRAAGVDLSGVSRTAGSGTAISLIVVPPSGKKHILLAPNANAQWDEAAAAAITDAIADALPTSVLTADYEVPAAIVRRAVEAAARRGVRVVIDPAPGAQAERAILAQAVALTPNVEEASALTGIDCASAAGVRRAAEALAELGVELVCLKLADGGAFVILHGDAFRLPPAPTTVEDSTGAGDAFSAAVGIALLEGRPLLQAACLGVAAASAAVAGFGSQIDALAPDRIRSDAEMLMGRMEHLA